MRGEEENITAPVPVFDEGGKWNGKRTKLIDTTKADYFEEIAELLESAGKKFTILDAFNALGVCAASFADPFTAYMVQLEAAAETYKVLPHGGGLLDEPTYIFEAFSIIRAARDDYYTYKIAKKTGV